MDCSSQASCNKRNISIRAWNLFPCSAEFIIYQEIFVCCLRKRYTNILLFLILKITWALTSAHPLFRNTHSTSLVGYSERTLRAFKVQMDNDVGQSTRTGNPKPTHHSAMREHAEVCNNPVYKESVLYSFITLLKSLYTKIFGLQLFRLCLQFI